MARRTPSSTSAPSSAPACPRCAKGRRSPSRPPPSAARPPPPTSRPSEAAFAGPRVPAARPFASTPAAPSGPPPHRRAAPVVPLITLTESTLILNSFSDLPLIAPLQRALSAANYTQPTPIQAQAIPPLLAGRDLLGCAQTGTGKTAAFALPILQRLAGEAKRAAPRSTRVLVLTPTRELAIQIAESFRTYGRNLALRSAVIYGGVGQSPQVNALAQGVDVLVATPGRLLDLMNQRLLPLHSLRLFVLPD